MVEVTVAYGEQVAVDGVSLSVDQGETLAVVGPSGSGKTTLLRAVAGLEPLRSGAITAGGVAIDALPTHRRDLGLMFQDDALFPQLDVAGNIAFGLRMAGWSSARRRGRVADLLSMMGLDGYGRRAVHELSGGEAQRVALARALAPEPRLLMLDEPFGSLDRVLREQLTAEVRRLLTSLGQTALHVTHDQQEAFALADRVAVLRDGRVEQWDTPEALWRAPISPFVAEFLGHPNRWTLAVDPDGVTRLGSHALGPLAGVGARTAGAVDGSEAAVRVDGSEAAVRVVVPTPAVRVVDAADEGAIPATVNDVTFAEGRFRVEAVVLDPVSTAPDGVAPTVAFHHDRRLAPGERVRLAVDGAMVHVLDGGERDR
ncbi:MAG: ABC transporter ATP-binding protein [Actinomycetota bacterium]